MLSPSRSKVAVDLRVAPPERLGVAGLASTTGHNCCSARTGRGSPKPAPLAYETGVAWDRAPASPYERRGAERWARPL
jgi:hypothetical protein